MGKVVLPEESNRSRIYRSLRQAIIDGEMAAGDRISEDAVAEKYEVSRTPVREALAALESEGLVEVSGRRMIVRRFSEDEIRDIFDVRAMIEPAVAKRAAGRIDSYDLTLLRDINTDYREQGLLSLSTKGEESAQHRIVAVRRNREFHLQVVKVLRNDTMTAIVSQVVNTPLVYHGVRWFGEREIERTFGEHNALIEALEAGDGDRAEEIWREHLDHGRVFLLQALELPE